jgi:hypothetical protein
MKNTFRYKLLWPALLAAFALGAQTAPERQADFILRQQGSQVEFEPVLPPLMQMAGAPRAYYEHYWEFGDGEFSFEARPAHTYADSGAYEVYYLATGKYDNGKAPKSRKKKTEQSGSAPPRAVAQASPRVLPHPAASLGLRAVRNPRAEEEFVCILAYANPSPITQSGRLYLFFNQRDYRREHFRFLEARAHFGEREAHEAWAWAEPPFQYEAWAGLAGAPSWRQVDLPSANPEQALAELRGAYASARSWRYEGLSAGESRRLFISLEASPHMLADTNAIINLTALLISDDQRSVERYELEIEILASHDPNYLAVSRRRTGFRGIQSQSFVYKAHFQNTGEGPASRVEITCEAPLGLNAAGIQILDYYPACPFCPEGGAEWSCLDTTFREGKFIFTFHNIYLPGTRQEGVRDRDSTKGFVKYRLRPAEDIRKLDLSPRARIIFDKNPPIVTNRALTHFKPGLSPGLLAGWTIYPRSRQPDHFSLGLSLSPFKSYRPYLQWELWVGLPGNTIGEDGEWRDTVRWVVEGESDLPFPAIIDSTSTLARSRVEKPVLFQFVPLQLRENARDWLGFGGGLLLNLRYRRVEINETHISERIVYRIPDDTVPLPDYYRRIESESSRLTRGWTAQAAIFADVQLGQVRRGPSVGLRALLPLERDPAPLVSLFAGWKL